MENQKELCKAYKKVRIHGAFFSGGLVESLEIMYYNAPSKIRCLRVYLKDKEAVR